jgi:hypothetical protein
MDVWIMEMDVIVMVITQIIKNTSGKMSNIELALYGQALKQYEKNEINEDKI